MGFFGFLRFAFIPPIRQIPLITVQTKADAAKLPTRLGREKITVGFTDMIARCCARSAAQHHLIRHELAVVFSDRALRRFVSWIWKIRALGPFPDVAEHLAGV